MKYCVFVHAFSCLGVFNGICELRTEGQWDKILYGSLMLNRPPGQLEPGSCYLYMDLYGCEIGGFGAALRRLSNPLPYVSPSSFWS